MDAAERALKHLDEISDAPREAGPVSLSQEYLDAIKWAESLPQNQSGSDKTALRHAQMTFENHYTLIRRP